MNLVFSVIALINEQATGCIIEETVGTTKEVAIGAIITTKNLPSYYFI